MPGAPHLGRLIGLWLVEAVGKVMTEPAPEALGAGLMWWCCSGEGFEVMSLSTTVCP
jgi:hypothetical protein